MKKKRRMRTKTIQTRIFTLVITFLSFSSIWAEKAIVDGIYYNLNDDGTAEVTYRGEEEDGWMYYTADELYVGDVNVPEQIEYSGNSYKVTSLGNDAFAGSRYLTSVILPSTISSISSGIFTLCNGLEYIQVDENNPTFLSHEGIMYNRDPLSIFFVPKSISGNISLLDEIRDIPSSTFQNCEYITTIKLPSEVTNISDGAFNNCKNLQEIFLGDKVENIGVSAFSKCSSLTTISMPQSLKSIGAGSFSDCSNLTYVILNEGLEDIGKMAFYNCPSIMALQLPNSLTAIGDQAFKECVNLDIIKNDSDLPIELGSTSYGYVAYYASEIIKDSQSSVGDTKANQKISIFRENNHWVISNASGQWVKIYSVKGQEIGRRYCTENKELFDSEDVRIIVVKE